jgi:hypothetical protein
MAEPWWQDESIWLLVFLAVLVLIVFGVLGYMLGWVLIST